MAYCKAALPLLSLVFVIVALQCCEGRVGTQGEELLAINPSESSFEDVIPLRPFLQSVVTFLNSWATGDTNQQQQELGNGIQTDEEERYFNTSGAEFVYNEETEEEEEYEGKSHLELPSERSKPRACETGNYIDDCWRCNANWANNRQRLASCGLGFGKDAKGGKGGQLYVVNSTSDDVKNPAPGSLRYGATRTEPLWITFAKNMTIELKDVLKVSSFTTLDGRGADVHLVGTSQLSIEHVNNVIVHGLHVHDIVRVEHKFEGDAIHIKNSSNVWIDHCYLSRAYDGLVDVTKNSTAVTISNCFLEHHDKVMLFGASADDEFDRNMQVTVAFNKFGTNLTQRMPRCRYGNCHVANNVYTSGWNLYAIGGSEDPTILSQANRFTAPDASDKKEVTQRIDDGGPTFGGWETWDWTSVGDSFANGAFFTGSGVQNASASNYDRVRSFVPRHASSVQAMTADAGPLKCSRTTC